MLISLQGNIPLTTGRTGHTLLLGHKFNFPKSLLPTRCKPTDQTGHTV